MPSSSGRTRAFRWADAGILAAAALLRVAFLRFLPLADDGNDSYLQPAFELLRSGRYTSFATLHRLPGEPFFLAMLMGMCGEHPRVLVAAQHLLGIGTLAFAMSAARRAWGEAAATATGFLLLGQLQLPFQECFLLSESLAQLLFAASLWFAVKLLSSRGDARTWAAAGIACALAALTRGEFVILAPGVLVLALASRLRREGPHLAPAAAFAAVWLALVGGWAARNEALFGYFGLTPDSVTTLADTALPFVRFDGGVEPEAKAILRQQEELARTTPRLDPRSTTIDRLQRERGYDYLRAETAMGRIAWETVRLRPMAYARAASGNARQYLLPTDWLGFAQGLPSVRAAEANPLGGSTFFWGLLRADVAWGYAPLGAAAAAVMLLLLGARRGEGRFGILFLGAYSALWLAVSFSDRIVPRIQAELFIPLSLLGSYTAQRFYRPP